jgi:hypothetical protein
MVLGPQLQPTQLHRPMQPQPLIQRLPTQATVPP